MKQKNLFRIISNWHFIQIWGKNLWQIMRYFLLDFLHLTSSKTYTTEMLFPLMNKSEKIERQLKMPNLLSPERIMEIKNSAAEILTVGNWYDGITISGKCCISFKTKQYAL